jgi:hypothetical protein
VALIDYVRVVLGVSVMEQIDIERSEIGNTKDMHILSVCFREPRSSRKIT